MRAGISSEKSSIRRSGIEVTGMETAGSRRWPCCHARPSARLGKLGFVMLGFVVLHADLHRPAGEAQLSRQLDCGIEGIDLGRERIGALGRNHDCPAVSMRND